MTQATTHNTNTPRRAHPAVVRAALRSCNTHRFAYDKLDRMVKEIRPLGQTISYAYDPNGNLTQVTDPKGQIKQYVYDNANRRTQENHYLNAAAVTANNAAKTITYTYNTLDRLTGYSLTSSLQANGNTSATYTYDARQLRQTGESVNYAATGAAPAGFTLATSTTYNALGQKNSLTYPDGATYRYSYDSNNQLSTVNLPTGPNANTASITFNSYQWTVPAQITLPGGTVRTQDYDGLLRVKDISVKDPGQSRVLDYQYGYDTTGNITSKATEAGSSTGSLQAITNYGYDTLDRLTTATYTNQTTPQTNETYTYDPVANRITDHRTTAAWTYNENNQLETADGISYTYDDNGNTTNQTDANGSTGSPQARNYVYDTDNRLIEVRDGGNTLIAAYSYDPSGRRLSKDTGTQKTYYFYNAEGLIAEADAAGQVTRSYGYAPGSTFTTNPLWVKATAMGSQTQSYYYYQNDHLGTPMKLLNQSGVVVWSATYDSFGKATIDPASTVTNNLRFPGQYYDAETGLHYNWFRYYDPGPGRYVTSDPIGLWGGINMYTYVRGNPISYVDPMGLDVDLQIRPPSMLTLTTVSALRRDTTLDQAVSDGALTRNFTLPAIGIAASGNAIGLATASATACAVPVASVAATAIKANARNLTICTVTGLACVGGAGKGLEAAIKPAHTLIRRIQETKAIRPVTKPRRDTGTVPR